eukprot:1159421-Pelagomonas_calceolata.AAC.13
MSRANGRLVYHAHATDARQRDQGSRPILRLQGGGPISDILLIDLQNQMPQSQELHPRTVGTHFLSCCVANLQGVYTPQRGSCAMNSRALTYLFGTCAPYAGNKASSTKIATCVLVRPFNDCHFCQL